VDLDLIKMRTQKLRLEIETANRLKQLHIHPLDALDELIHGIIELRKVGLKKQFPNASEEELLAIMREQVKYFQNLKNRNRFKKG
jgi:hypothetical protein